MIQEGLSTNWIKGKEMKNVEIIVSEFVNASISNGKAQESGNANLANKSYDVIEKKIRWLKEHDELNNPAFFKLIDDENDYIRYYTSCALLHFDDVTALHTLSDIAEKRGLLGFSAKMTISEFKKGNI